MYDTSCGYCDDVIKYDKSAFFALDFHKLWVRGNTLYQLGEPEKNVLKKAGILFLLYKKKI